MMSLTFLENPLFLHVKLTLISIVLYVHLQFNCWIMKELIYSLFVHSIGQMWGKKMRNHLLFSHFQVAIFQSLQMGEGKNELADSGN